MEGTVTELFRARQKRIEDAIALRVPDRVPVWLGDCGYFPAKYAGFTCEEAMFESDKLFAAYTKYWPSLKKVILALVEAGLTPCPFFEGDYSSRLEHLAELPKGKILGLFDNTDPAKAKDVLAGMSVLPE